jgi:hypothetical protein
MTFTAQLDELAIALRRTRSRLLAPLDFRQQQLPRDPEIFVEDVLLYVMDEWGADLRQLGHVLEEDTGWNDAKSHYPRYTVRIVGGGSAQLHFTGEYPKALYLSISKGFRAPNQFSDARQANFELPLTTDPNVLLISLLEGLRNASV